MDLMPINGVMVLNISSRMTCVGLVALFGVLIIITLLFIVAGLWEDFFNGKELFASLVALSVLISCCAFFASQREPVYQITVTDEAKATEILEHYEIMKIEGKIITVKDVNRNAE